MPRARLVRIPGCGHCVDMEQPEALARLITA
jgi:pimeloyl-ACP methyl ester carboxylesterase